jgi:hypothetical protein
MKKVLIEREKSDARIDSSEREEARPKVKILFLHGFFASGLGGALGFFRG